MGDLVDEPGVDEPVPLDEPVLLLALARRADRPGQTLERTGFLHAAPASRFASMAMTFALSGPTAKRSRHI